MSPPLQWVAVEVRVHDNEPDVVDPDTHVQALERAFTESLRDAHEVLGGSYEGRQVLTFVRTSDVGDVFERARQVYAVAGIASVTGHVWDGDPRADPGEAAKTSLLGPQGQRVGIRDRFADVIDDLLGTTGEDETQRRN
jgi:hypothetical protein